MFDYRHIDLPQQFPRDGSAKMLGRAGLARGLDLTLISEKIFLLEGNGRLEYFEWTMPASTSYLAKVACKSKPLAKEFFRRNGVPTPHGFSFIPRQMQKAAGFMRSAGCTNFVLKPADGALGEMVFMNIGSEQALREKCAQFKKRRPLLLEEQVEGPECRYFVLGDRVIAVAARKPANVVGDGQGTISALIERKNADRKGHLTLKAIDVDAETQYLLVEQGLSLDSVLAEGQAAQLKRVSNISQGGDSVDMTDMVHDDMKAMAVAALQSIPSMHYAGVDVIAEDHTAPLARQRAVVLEINSYPMIIMHHAPAVGQPRDVAGAIIDHLFFS